jgi:GDP-L-fucose synthase
MLELAGKIANIIGFKGEIKLDLSRPDGMPQKLLDVSKINNLGWKAKIDIEEGIRQTYDYFLKTYEL